ncbi:MAG: type II secretion system F family protein [Microthrixaceae bacterium]
MTAVLLPAALALLAGSTMLLQELPWFRRSGLAARLGPYAPTGAARRRRASTGFRQLLLPGVDRAADRLSKSLGVSGDLATRLERAGLDEDPGDIRLRQFTRALGAVGLAVVVALAWRPPIAFCIATLVAAPLLMLLVEEHRINAAVERRRRRLRSELPVVVEQLGLLMTAGYSLPSALQRLADRSNGVVATDLRAVVRRMGHGLTANAALDEWSRRCGVDAVARLVAVLRLHSEAGDLGSLISSEARSVRAEAHRELLETIERRAQLVWVPVTVATLVPGLIFLAVPFMSAMSQVAG